ncbi:hypothetical protein DL95DRAFT_456019 [Leptodontidium sp. 2 PMI_412]|nr:hypothetical protein DL95DRAFT_456019 [Leptodontidium sp. 2 PMI_412]
MDISTNIYSTIQSGLAISKNLFDLGDKAGPTVTEPTQWAVKISLLNSTLGQIRSAITQGKGGRYTIGAAAIVQRILERCEQIHGELEIITNRIQLQDSRKEGLTARVRCEFERVEVKIMKATMEACNITLHLMHHNLAITKQGAGRRHSSFGMNVENQQQDLIIQALQTSRHTTITTLEHLENGGTSIHSQSLTRSTNKLRKLKPPNKRTEMRDSNIQKERASDWVKNLVRLERNNSLISLEFSPGGSGEVEGILDGKMNGENWAVRGRPEGVGELQGDGPDDLVRRSERMEYTKGWPSV